MIQTPSADAARSYLNTKYLIPGHFRVISRCNYLTYCINTPVMHPSMHKTASYAFPWVISAISPSFYAELLAQLVIYRSYSSYLSYVILIFDKIGNNWYNMVSGTVRAHGRVSGRGLTR